VNYLQLIQKVKYIVGQHIDSHYIWVLILYRNLQLETWCHPQGEERISIIKSRRPEVNLANEQNKAT